MAMRSIEAKEVIGDLFYGTPLGGEPEGSRRLTKDGGAYLDASEVAHLLAGPDLLRSNSLRFTSCSG
ncbi:hypothetical protein AB0D71_33580 [Streptomyces avermitilis]|uniref:hypothetical protein n=1 Tax=Streptomyces avermitilis TaxID=33903 RepID=UPI0033E16EC4